MKISSKDNYKLDYGWLKLRKPLEVYRRLDKESVPVELELCSEHKRFEYMNQIAQEIFVRMHNEDYVPTLFDESDRCSYLSLLKHVDLFCIGETDEGTDELIEVVSDDDMFRFVVPQMLYAMLYDDFLEYENCFWIDDMRKIHIVISEFYKTKVKLICEYFSYEEISCI